MKKGTIAPIISLIFIAFLLTTSSCENTEITENILADGEMFDEMLINPGTEYSSLCAMAADADGVLWICLCNRVIAYYNGKFQVFDQFNTEIPFSNTRSLFVDEQNTKWFGNNLGNVFCYDNKEWKLLPTPEGVGSINRIIQAETGEIWVSGVKTTGTINDPSYEYGIWNYVQGSLGDVYFSEFADMEISDIAADSDTGVWACTYSGTWKPNKSRLFRYDGQTWTSHLDNVPDSRIVDMLSDKKNGGIYCRTAGNNGSIYKYQNGIFEDTTPRSIHAPSMQLDSRGNLCLFLGGSLHKYDGNSWNATRFGDGITDSIWRYHGAIIDSKDRLWCGGLDSSHATRIIMYDGEVWSSLPVTTNDPRTRWRQKGLAELFDDPTTTANASEIREHFLDYVGKKISVTGNTQYAWMNAPDWPGPLSIFNLSNNNLWLFPEYHPALKHLQQTTGFTKGDQFNNLWEQSTPKEYVGYLEPEQYHNGNQVFILYITEIYPPETTEQEKQAYRDIYRDYIVNAESVREEIIPVLSAWVSARKSGVVKELLRVFHPESSVYREYTDSPYSREKTQIYSIEIVFNINNIRIEADGDTARVYFSDIVYNPPDGTYQDTYYEFAIIPSMPMILKKDGEIWTIMEEGYYSIATDGNGGIPTTTT